VFPGGDLPLKAMADGKPPCLSSPHEPSHPCTFYFVQRHILIKMLLSSLLFSYAMKLKNKCLVLFYNSLHIS
jgi:hypothetical protein